MKEKWRERKRVRKDIFKEVTYNFDFADVVVEKWVKIG